MTCSAETRPRVLVLTPFYLPGSKGGGTITSVANLVRALGGEFEFSILTADRDWTDTSPYPGISTGEWLPCPGGRVRYLGPGERTLNSIRTLVRAQDPALLYLNSYFNTSFTIKPLLLRRFGGLCRLPVLLAPRGQIMAGALRLKRGKKLAYKAFSVLLGLYRDIVWHSTSDEESAEIRLQWGTRSRICLAANVPSQVRSQNGDVRTRKKPMGALKAIFLSRVSRKKNLEFALDCLARVRGNVELGIYGPLEDAPYWAECQKFIETLPHNISVTYHGELEHRQVADVMATYDLFFLPTLSENFGHVFVEAWCAGLPVLISDQTPWRELQAKGAGWDIPLDQRARFTAVLQECVDAEPERYEDQSRNATAFGLSVLSNSKAVEQTRNMLKSAMQSNGIPLVPSHEEAQA